MIDDQLTFPDHIAKTAWSCRFALFNIKKVRGLMYKYSHWIHTKTLRTDKAVNVRTHKKIRCMKRTQVHRIPRLFSLYIPINVKLSTHARAQHPTLSPPSNKWILIWQWVHFGKNKQQENGKRKQQDKKLYGKWIVGATIGGRNEKKYFIWNFVLQNY